MIGPKLNQRECHYWLPQPNRNAKLISKRNPITQTDKRIPKLIVPYLCLSLSFSVSLSLSLCLSFSISLFLSLCLTYSRLRVERVLELTHLLMLCRSQRTLGQIEKEKLVPASRSVSKSVLSCLRECQNLLTCSCSIDVNLTKRAI